MADTSKVSNLIMTQDARTFMIVLNIPEPLEGQVLDVVPFAEWDFDSIAFYHRLAAGFLEAIVSIEGVVVPFEAADSFGFVGTDESLLASPGAIQQYDPESSSTVDLMLANNSCRWPISVCMSLSVSRCV